MSAAKRPRLGYDRPACSDAGVTNEERTMTQTTAHQLVGQALACLRSIPEARQLSTYYGEFLAHLEDFRQDLSHDSSAAELLTDWQALQDT